jgi:hypothetical protein
MAQGDANRRKGGSGAENARKERLAAQLRENLKRRKARERAMEARRPDDPQDGLPGPDQESSPEAGNRGRE